MGAFSFFQKWFKRSLTCKDANQFIVQYLENNLPTHTRTLFEKHIAMCPVCSTFLEQYRTTIELVQEEANETLSAPPELIELTLAFMRKHYPNA